MALKSGLPNEIDWAVHTVYLRSAVSGYGTGHGRTTSLRKRAGRLTGPPLTGRVGAAFMQTF